jgi:hypothetical protein
MAYKLKIIDKTNGLNFNVRYENMSKVEKPEIIAKAPDGSICHERTIFQGKVLAAGSTQRNWVDDNGKIYMKAELKFSIMDGDTEIPVQENEQTKVFTITSFETEANYLDKFVIGTYYELYPDDDGFEKDHDRNRAKNENLSQMRKLWQQLKDSNKGFLASDGYIRAIEIEGKWGLEIGIFKEMKIFSHLNEGIPVLVESEPIKKRIKNL